MTSMKIRRGTRCYRLVFLKYKIYVFKLGRIAQRMALDEDQANLKLFQDRYDHIIQMCMGLHINTGFWKTETFTLTTRGRDSLNGLA